MKNNTEYTEKILDPSVQEAIFNLREVIVNMTKDNAEDLKALVRVLEKLFDNNKAITQSLDIDKTIAQLLNISEDKVKKLSNRENAKLDAIMKKLFETSPRMFLGTIDNLYETNYRQQYLTGRLVDSDIKFLPTEFVRETFRFEVLKADINLQIKDNYYQIEIQTSHDNMAIRFARYGLEIGLKKRIINPETGALQIEFPEQSVIYLENNQNNPRPNDYELWWRNEKLATIQVKDLKIWELDIDDMLEKNLYNLLPMSIFQYRIRLLKTTSKKEKQKIKNEFLKKAKQVLKKAKALSAKLVDGDIDLIITILGELINYFDSVFFDGSIERLGEFSMTFTEEIQGYRTRINTALKEGKAEGKAEGIAEGIVEGIITVAKNSLKKGFAIDVIMEITGLPEEEVKQLQSEIEKSYKVFNGAIEKMGECDMTFTEEIKGYRTKINTAKEEGLAEGIKKAKEEGIAEGIEKGKAEGIAEGKAEGIAEGIEKGKVEGKAEGLLEGLEKGLKKGIKKGKLEGKIKGKEEGEAKGRVREKIEIATNFLQDGFEIDCIMKNTGLSEERLKKLQAVIKQS